MCDIESSADPEPPCRGKSSSSSTQLCCEYSSGSSIYGCFKCHPKSIRSTFERPKSPFTPKVFDWESDVSQSSSSDCSPSNSPVFLPEKFAVRFENPIGRDWMSVF